MKPGLLLRSLLFVPGNRERMLLRAATSGADCIVVDLEDAVPASEKRAARALLRSQLPALTAGGTPVFARVNNVRTGATRADLIAAVRPGLAGVVHPKSQHPQDLRDLDVLLREAELRNKVRPGDTVVIALVETPKGILRCDDLATAIDRTIALALGGEDYATELGVPRSDAALAYPRGALITVAAARGLAAVDTPWPVIDDAEGLAREAQAAAAMGFRGKFVIHPAHVDAVNAAFSPTADDIAGARRVLAAAAKARTARKGAIALDGKMIDAPIIARAERIIAAAESIAARAAPRTKKAGDAAGRS